MFPSPLFDLKGVSCSAHKVPILKQVSFTISSGSFLSILGPLGSGKSTLLRMFNALLSPTAGNILYRGEPLESCPVRTLRREVGMVFQQAALIPGTVHHNLLLPYRWDKDSPPPPDWDLIELLAKIGLEEEALVRDCRSLSVGEQQRVALARVLLNEPEVLLLDEPTSGMDPGLANQILRLITRLRDQLHLTVLIVTHYPRLLRDQVTKVLFLKGGKMLDYGGPELLVKTPSEELKRFLREEA